jgi:large exoprotein involved in heme utilization and adhesion
LGEDGSFNATQPQTSNLLSVNPSALFFNAVAAQAIVNRSQAAGMNGETNSIGDPVGLQVPEGKSLALIGGDVLLESGNLTATGGRIELGSVAGEGEVSLNQNRDDLLLGYEGVETFGDIRLERAFVDANEGSAKIETGNLLTSDGGQVFTGTFGERDGGNLTVNATESIELIGTSTNGELRSGLITRTEGNGKAGNLTITTKNLIVRHGAGVSTRTKGQGRGGSLNVNATESIELIGTSADSKFRSGLFADARRNGDAGNLTITTENLIVRDGALVSTRTKGQGRGGSLNVNATESIELIGTSADGKSRSGLLTNTLKKGRDAGNLTITTKRLIVRDGATVSVATFSDNEGDGGNLNVNATESIELIGTSADSESRSGLFAQTKRSGDAGNISLATKQLTILNGATINNQSIGTGTAGNLKLDVSGTLLVDNSDISSRGIQSSGGAIKITAGDIRLRGDSDITTDVSTGTGNGGDINLTADSIVAFDDSDILASASDGSGGDINLDTPAFFGDGYQDSSLNTKQNSLEGNNRADVNATGAFNGIITLPDVSFIQNNLATLPQVFLNTNDLIASSCIARRDQKTGSFTITGNDSLPTPSQSNDSAYPTGTVQTIPNSNFNDHRPWKKGDPIIEPTGVYRLPNGELVMSRECSQ